LCRISARSSQSQALLANIRECFDSVIPGLIATCDADGVPNMAYRSQVQFIDLEHVALAYPFFNKTRQNVLLKPKVRLLLTLQSAKKNGNRVLAVAVVVRVSTGSGGLATACAGQTSQAQAQKGEGLRLGDRSAIITTDQEGLRGRLVPVIISRSQRGMPDVATFRITDVAMVVCGAEVSRSALDRQVRIGERRYQIHDACEAGVPLIIGRKLKAVVQLHHSATGVLAGARGGVYPFQTARRDDHRRGGCLSQQGDCARRSGNAHAQSCN
jgi:predicted pyridoxine 5'-phosphate oxidase superfamily flavin-nucleotide-binding protein